MCLNIGGSNHVKLKSYQQKLYQQNRGIEIINNKARHNLIDAKYQQMAFRSVPTTLLFGIWSNTSDANLEDSDCTVQMLLIVSIKINKRKTSYRKSQLK